MAAKKPDDKNQKIVRAVTNYKREAEEAKRERMERNKANYDSYHLRQDYSHKKAGQSKEFLPKQSMAVEQITSFVHQGLVDQGEWFTIMPKPGNKQPLMTDDEARSVLGWKLEEAQFFVHIQDALKSGLLGSLMIAKVHGEFCYKSEYFTRKNRASKETELKRKKKLIWKPRIDLVRHQDYYPDPTGEGLYELETIEMDLWQLRKIAENEPDEYDMEQIDLLSEHLDQVQKNERERETGQSPTNSNFRKRVTLTECWGTILDDEGEVLIENGVVTLANDLFVVRRPSPNPFWHGMSPYVAAPLIRVPNSVWHRALMDAPTALNQALNEIFNLELDAGIMSVFGVRQVREHWIDNADEISNGIPPGQVLKANSSCPPGMKVYETVSTGSLSQESSAMRNSLNSEFHTAALTNDLRMGVLPDRSVKATEVVEASNAITGVFSGVSKTIEESYVKPILERVWLTTWQHTKDLDSDAMISLVGDVRARKLAATPHAKLFEQVVNGHDFKVFGITQTLNKIKDFRKLTSLLQTVGSAPTLAEEFQREFDFRKLLKEIMKALDINVDKIRLDQADSLMNEVAGLQSDAGNEAPGVAMEGPDDQSQIPQASGTSPEGSMLSATPRMEFAQ